MKVPSFLKNIFQVQVNKSMLFDKVIVATPNMEIYDHVEVFGDVILAPTL